MEIGSLVRDKIMNRIGIVIDTLGSRLRVRWSDGLVFWALVRNVEVLCEYQKNFVFFLDKSFKRDTL